MEQPILSFLTAYFSDLHIQCRLTDRKQLELADLDLGLRNSILMQEADAQKQAPFPFVQNTIYFIVDYYECNYSFFRLPDKSAFLFVGPFLWREFERSQILSLMNRLDIPTELFPQLQEYYHALPLIADKASMTALLRHVYQTLDVDADVSVQTLHLKDLETRESFLEKHQFVVPEDPVLSMHLLEERYHIEDELLDAISHGNSARALSFMEALGNLRFVPRTEDALRNRKNLILTLNTLLRRKAYETGVHPFYIDAVSGNFARMIESIQSVEEINDLISYMVQSYCQLVEQRSMSSYSDPIRQILVTIDASLTGDLSLKRFASELFLNTSYLSTLFKKEVGMTLTDYVNANRIEYAKKLLRSTLLPVQDVAAACGIPDVHYFTRLFRRITDMTPREWRR